MASKDNLRVELESQHPSRTSDQHEAAEHPHSWSQDMLLQRLRADEPKQDDKFADIMDAMGGFGTFQRRLVALTFIPSLLVSFFLFADVFVVTPQKPYCNTSWILAVGPNLSEAEQLNLTLPRDASGSFLMCLMYLPVPWDLESIIKFGLNYTQACRSGWIYPESKTRSVINEFDLVCREEDPVEIVQITFLAGLLLGSLLFGFLSDKFGRYPSILLSILGMIIFGFGTAFVTSFNQYLFFRFGVSQALTGYNINIVTLVTEWLTSEYRAHAIILEHCFFSLGIMFLTGMAYSLSHWRMLFLLGGVPVFSLISYIWILPESPRWLVVKGKVEKAKQVLCYAADMNKKTIPSSLLDKLQVPRKATHTSALDFYCNKHLCKAALLMTCVWFTVSYTYYTLSLKIRHFGLSRHFSEVVAAIVEVPSVLCSAVLLQQIGRKWSLALAFFQGTFMNLLLLIFPSELKTMIVLLTVLGQFSLVISISVFYVYTAELLPTVLRATGLGLVSLAWAAGSILSLILSSYRLRPLSDTLCFITAICALFLYSMLPETQDQPLPDSLEQCFLWRRGKSNSLTTEDRLCDDATEELVRNTILNAMRLNFESDLLRNTSLQAKGQTAGRQND